MADFDFQQSAQDLQDFVNRTPAEIAELRALYEALTQTGVTPVAADDWPVSDPHENVIYRVAGTSSYTDYMWNGSSFIPMATYDNVPTDIPAVGSTDVITAGGVANHGSAFDISEYNKIGSTLATYADLSAALAAVPSTVQKGGMSVKFIQSSDNKYVQYRLVLNNWSSDANYWICDNNHIYEPEWIDNTYIEKDTGNIISYPLGGFASSKLIAISSKHTYLLCGIPSDGSATCAVAFYDINGSFIDDIEAPYGTVYDYTPFNIPSGTAFLRLCKRVNDFYLAVDNTALIYAEGMKEQLEILESNVNSLILYEPEWIDGFWFISKDTGSIVPYDSEFTVSEKLNITTNSKLRISGEISGSAIYGVAFYNSSNVCLGGLTEGTYTDYDVQIPANTAYVRFCVREGYPLNIFVDRDTIISNLQNSSIEIKEETEAIADYNKTYLKPVIVGELWNSSNCLDEGNYTINGVYFNSTRKFKKLTCSCGRTNDLDIKIVNLNTLQVIETIRKSCTAGVDIVVVPEDFQFDFDNNITKIGIFIENAILGSEDEKRVVPFKDSDNEDLLAFVDGSTTLLTLPYKPAMQFEIEEPLAIIREIENLKGGSSSDVDLQTYINTNRDVKLQAGTYYIDNTITIPSGTKITGVRGSTIIKLRNATTCFNIGSQTDISIENITFEGTGAITPASITLNDVKNRVGEGSEVGIYVSGTPKSIFISNCRFKNFDLAGIRIYRASGDLTECCKITDCIFKNNWYGLLSDVRSEYHTVVGCSFNMNEIGCYIAGGNNYMSCCHFDENAVGCVISGTLGDNDSHGSIGTSSFNHNTVYSLCCIDVNNGFVFTGFGIYDGNIAIENSKSLLFDGGAIAAAIDYTNAPASQICMISNCLFYKTYGGGTISDTTRLLLKNNHFADGTDSSSINN